MSLLSREELRAEWGEMLHQHDSAFCQGSPSIHHPHRIISPFRSPRRYSFHVLGPYVIQRWVRKPTHTHVYTHENTVYPLSPVSTLPYMGCFCPGSPYWLLWGYSPLSPLFLPFSNCKATFIRFPPFFPFVRLFLLRVKRSARSRNS